MMGDQDFSEKRVLKLVNTTEYCIIQENGQRKYGGPPPGWKGGPPPKGSEVYVSHIPRDCLEDELVPIFTEVGNIYLLRLMMDFSGTNRGFCFVQYTNPLDARRAIKELDGFEVRAGRRIHVTKSVDNCRLFVGQIPKDKSKQQIMNTLRNYVSGIVDVIMYFSCTDKTKNRGFCFVEFDCHRSAAIARRDLNTMGMRLGGYEIRVDWAKPEVEIDEDVMSKVTVVYVRNLMLFTSEMTIKSTLLNIVEEKSISRLRKVRDFAFIHFASRSAAETAIQGLNGLELDGAIISASWARPKWATEVKIKETSVIDLKALYKQQLAIDRKMEDDSNSGKSLQPYWLATKPELPVPPLLSPYATHHQFIPETYVPAPCYSFAQLNLESQNRHYKKLPASYPGEPCLMRFL